MKKLIASALILFIALFFYSCKEIGPDIVLKKNVNAISDTTYIESPIATPELKNVVIEEFTGVRCPNCPQGHQIITAIKAANPDRIVAVSLHPINSLGAPYSFSVQDFRSQKAQDLFDYLGQIGLEPAAGIDRKIFSGETNVLLEKTKWTSYVDQQMLVPVPVNVLLSSQYDTASRELTIAVELHYTQTITEQNRLTVVLIESNIVTAQLNGSVIDTFYNHKDIMRDFLTATQGDAINYTLEVGRVVRKIYKRTLDPVWKPKNMHVAAYVHQFSSLKNIYQGKEKEITQ
jgi:hypothetical protein